MYLYYPNWEILEHPFPPVIRNLFLLVPLQAFIAWQKKENIKIFSNKSGTLKSTNPTYNSSANVGCNEDDHNFLLHFAPPPIGSYRWVLRVLLYLLLASTHLWKLQWFVSLCSYLGFKRDWTNPEKVGPLVIKCKQFQNNLWFWMSLNCGCWEAGIRYSGGKRTPCPISYTTTRDRIMAQRDNLIRLSIAALLPFPT